MLLIHQEGSVKVGEVVRYTLTYTPSIDRILPSPSHLHVRIKNTSGIPYRAAFLVGPFNLHVSAYSSNFDPYKKVENPKRDGIPQFEPNLRAGGHWHAKLTVPEDIRESGERAQLNDNNDGSLRSATWIIEIASQILFSDSAAVHYELLVSRDARSLDTGFAALASRGHGEPGKVRELIQYQVDGPGRLPAPKGVYTKAVKLTVEDTAALWNRPALPTWPSKDAPTRKTADGTMIVGEELRPQSDDAEGKDRSRRRKKIHLVLVTHGLHSNVGADMLFLKESIDATAKQAREDAKRRKAKSKGQESANREEKSGGDPRSEPASEKESTSTAPLSGGQDEIADEDDDPDDEQIIVRGFSGNAARTEKGIQYLGKRLAKYILTLTYPDQPFLPANRSMTRSFTFGIGSAKDEPHVGTASHQHSSVHRAVGPREELPYTFTSISFIGHSLGGLIQLYAIGYIQKHSPDFFQQIRPKNFISMAAPLLGLSNENPLYVKFALDFGLVGRTGQDLGLTWRAPTIARSGWTAMISGLGGNDSQQKSKQEDPRSKPLLRILPSGPAHTVLKMFRNRTVYSNVVNDGIVPLRTSCLLFLDWRGLGRVENARRSNGLLSTMAQFGWAEVTGTNTMSHRPKSTKSLSVNSSQESMDHFEGFTFDDADRMESPKSPASVHPASLETTTPNQIVSDASIVSSPTTLGPRTPSLESTSSHSDETHSGPFDAIFNFFKPSPRSRSQHEATSRPRKVSKKARRTLKRAQIRSESGQSDLNGLSPANAKPADGSADRKLSPSGRPFATRGDSLQLTNSHLPPPKTSIFEAAGDILNPPIPTEAWLTDPSSRDRTIFHDRIYHPEDIPPPPRRTSRLIRPFGSEGSLSLPGKTRSNSRPSTRTNSSDETEPSDSGGMKVEEKIARAYHRDLSWRKVLVRLEPDAHNNMIVRRMFANAYGWDVVRHLCDTHFSDSYAANTKDENESGLDRAKPDEPMGKEGDKVRGQGENEEDASEEDSSHEGTATHRRSRSDSEVPPESSKAPKMPQHSRTISEMREATDSLAELRPRSAAASALPTHAVRHRDSMTWSDEVFEGTDDEWDE